MADDIPDLKVLLVELGTAVHAAAPEALPMEAVYRVRDAENVLLVASRVLMGAAKRAELVTQDQVKNIVKKSRISHAQPVFASSDEAVGKVDGNITDWQVMQQVDDCLFDPAKRSMMPDWFVMDLWPSALRRAAGGHGLSDRERAIAQYVTSIARGER